jgi:hypothetical protein
LFSVSWKLAQATHSTAPKTLQSRAIWLAASNERSSVLMPRSCSARLVYSPPHHCRGDLLSPH